MNGCKFKNNIWVANLTETGQLSYFNFGVKYFSSVIDVFTKYAWVKLLLVKKAKVVLNDFTGTVNNNEISYLLIES